MRLEMSEKWWYIFSFNLVAVWYIAIGNHGMVWHIVKKWSKLQNSFKCILGCLISLFHYLYGGLYPWLILDWWNGCQMTRCCIGYKEDWRVEERTKLNKQMNCCKEPFNGLCLVCNQLESLKYVCLFKRFFLLAKKDSPKRAFHWRLQDYLPIYPSFFR